MLFKRFHGLSIDKKNKINDGRLLKKKKKKFVSEEERKSYVRVSKGWQIFNCWTNYPFKPSFKQTPPSIIHTLL